MYVDAVVGAIGPFLIPAALFVGGTIAYVAFVLLTRQGVFPARDNTGND
ncbi:MAG: hypothetical protein V5A54_07285 [Haloarculaceae archaeon]